MENKRYETFTKVDGRFIFMGWYPLLNEEFCIETKYRGRFVYKTYKWLNGNIEVNRYTIKDLEV